MLLDDSTLFISLNAFLAISILLFISTSLFPSSVVIPPSRRFFVLAQLILCPPTFTPSISSISLNTFLMYRLNKLGDTTHPCLTPFFIWNSSVMLCPVHTTAVCSQYILVIIVGLYYLF